MKPEHEKSIEIYNKVTEVYKGLYEKWCQGEKIKDEWKKLTDMIQKYMPDICVLEHIHELRNMALFAYAMFPDSIPDTAEQPMRHKLTSLEEIFHETKEICESLDGRGI